MSQLPADFNTFILGLFSTGLWHLGAAPESKPDDINLPLAKQTIEWLELLEQKTSGNLSGDEERLLAQALNDLKMKFAQTSLRTK